MCIDNFLQETMIQNIKIAVLGGGGRTGKYLITELIAKGYSVKLLLRNPETFQTKSHLIEIIHGDAIDFVAVNSLLKNCQAVISTIGQRPGEPLVAEQATKNVLEAMSRNGINRYILLAGINVDTPFDKKGPETINATNWMKSNFPIIQEDRQKSYSLLVNSSINWTLLRVPFIDFNQAKSKMGISLYDCLGNKIDAGSIATFLTLQLEDCTYYNKVPFIYNA